jgi:hypothetical protein
MKFYLYNYLCKGCGNSFKAPQVPPHSYGAFLMRSLSGETRYLDGLNDEVYDDVDNLLKELLQGQGVSDYQRSEILARVFGVACDPDAQGRLFSLKIGPQCPDCASVEMDSWEGTEPPEYLELDFPKVSHVHWQSLSRVEKLQHLAQAVAQP